MIERTAWQAGTGKEITERLVEAFLHEVRAVLAEGRTVSLGQVGVLSPSGFVPGPGLASGQDSFADTTGYDEGTAPSDS